MPKVKDIYRRFIMLKSKEKTIVDNWNEKHDPVFRKQELEFKKLCLERDLANIKKQIDEVDNGVPYSYYGYGNIQNDLDLITEEIKYIAKSDAIAHGDDYLPNIEVETDDLAKAFNAIYLEGYDNAKEDLDNDN